MRRFLPAALAAVGLGLVLAGALVLAVSDGTPRDFGWTAYTPLPSSAAYDSRLTLGFDHGWTGLSSGARLVGAALAVVGLLVLAAVGGWALGRRSGARR